MSGGGGDQVDEKDCESDHSRLWYSGPYRALAKAYSATVSVSRATEVFVEWCLCRVEGRAVGTSTG